MIKLVNSSPNLMMFKVKVDGESPIPGEEPIVIVKWKMSDRKSSQSVNWNLLEANDPMNIIPLDIQSTAINATAEFLKTNHKDWLNRFYSK